MPPTPKDVSGQFATALFVSHYVLFVGLVQFIGGALLLSGRYIPLALTLLGPVLVNILLFHITMAPAGIWPGLVATVLWFIIFAGVRRAFAGIFAAKVAV